MSKDPFLLVSLEESESKALAQVMSNDTARKILDLLSKEEALTETEVSTRLKVPLSTVHYNLQALVKANLAVAEEFHYSKKGKEVLHYSLANKLIIIAPKKTNTQSFKDKLKSLLPIGLITLATAGMIELLSRFSLSATNQAAGAADASLRMATEEAAPLMAKAAVEDTAAGSAQLAAQALPVVPTPNFALWFLAGGLFVLLLLVIWFFFTRKK